MNFPNIENINCINWLLTSARRNVEYDMRTRRVLSSTVLYNCTVLYYTVLNCTVPVLDVRVDAPEAQRLVAGPGDQLVVQAARPQPPPVKVQNHIS